jgi:predicted nucleotidyltransferase
VRENHLKELITTKLESLERKQKVCVLYACESGSRAWGFASQDSDYDVRFIYAHPTDWYLSVRDKRDVIEQPIEQGIDLAGWDIRKALALFRKSNPPLLEWLDSPICYWERFGFAARLRELRPHYYSPRSCLHHYWHMAQGNFDKYVSGESIQQKRYFYVQRPVLACIWIEHGFGVVPMEFSKLVERIVKSKDLQHEITALLKKKISGMELDEGPRLPAIHTFLETEITRLKSAHGVGEAETTDLEKLDALFRLVLKQMDAHSRKGLHEG